MSSSSTTKTEAPAAISKENAEAKIEIYRLSNYRSDVLTTFIKHNEKVRNSLPKSTRSKVGIVSHIESLLEKNILVIVPPQCTSIYSDFPNATSIQVIKNVIYDYDDPHGDNDDGSAAASSIQTSTVDLLLEDCVRGKQGICYLVDNAPDDAKKLQKKYGDFNKLIDDQMKKIDYILGQFDDSECSAWDLIGFTIGKTNCQGWKNRHFSCFNSNTWKKTGIKDRFSKPPYNGGKDENSFKVMVVICAFTQVFLKIAGYSNDEKVKLGDQHDFALEVEQSLTTQFRRQRKDKRLTNVTSETGQGMAKGIGGIVYICLKLKSRDIDIKNDKINTKSENNNDDEDDENKEDSEKKENNVVDIGDSDDDSSSDCSDRENGEQIITKSSSATSKTTTTPKTKVDKKEKK